jgi:DNA-binding transcriptional LysR family regulator
MIASELAQGRLVVPLEDWSLTPPGVFLYRPSGRQTPMPLQVFIKFTEKWRRNAQA